MDSQSPSDLFCLFDPGAELSIQYANLPHWEQMGSTYFITMRTADSLPRAVVGAWLDSRDQWLRHHGLDPRDPAWPAAIGQLDANLQRVFRHTFTARWEQLLDDCHGECVLRRPELAQIVADAFLHFDGTRYNMGDFVIMPNHCHLLVQMLGTTELRPQCQSWTRYTATQINRYLGRKGRFWQDEPFDHLVRNPKQFEYLRCYIADNPRRAGLRAGAYLYYRRPDDQR